MSCRKEVGWGSPSESPAEGEDEGADDEELEFFWKALRNTLCLLECKKEQLGEDRSEMWENEVAQIDQNRVAVSKQRRAGAGARDQGVRGQEPLQLPAALLPSGQSAQPRNNAAKFLPPPLITEKFHRQRRSRRRPTPPTRTWCTTRRTRSW